MARSATRSTSSCRSAGPTRRRHRARVRRRRRARATASEPSDPGTIGRRLPRGPPLGRPTSSASRSSASASTAPRAELGRHRPSRSPACRARCRCRSFNTACAHARLRGASVDRRPQRRPAQRARDRAHVLRAAPARPPRDVYYGLLDGPSVGGLNGQANGIPGTAASSFTNQLDGPTSSGYARNTIVHELSHTLGVHHAVDNSPRHQRRLPLVGRQQDRRTAARSRPAAPGHSPFISVTGRTRPGLGSISSADNEVWGVDHRFARADENDLSLSEPADVWALMGYCSDGNGQFRGRRRSSATSDRRHPLPRAVNGGGGGVGDGSWVDTGEIDSPADVVAPPAGHHGVLISGSVNATTRRRRQVRAADALLRATPRPARATTRCGVEDAAGALLTERRFTPRCASATATATSDRVASPRRRDPAGGHDRQGHGRQHSDGAARLAHRAAGRRADGGRRRDLRPAHRARPGHAELEALGGLGQRGALLARRRRVLAPARVPPDRRVAGDRPETLAGTGEPAASPSPPPTGCAARSRSSRA